MKPYSPASALLESFGRSVLRQPIFTVIVFLAPAMGLVVRLCLVLLGRYLPAFDAGPWIPLILAVSAGFPPYLYGLLAALMLLDEKDKGLLPALRTTPITDRSLLTSRTGPAAVLASVGAPLTIYLSGESGLFPPWIPPVMGILAAPLTVFYTLLVIRLSSTKVQALTVGKILSVLIMTPIGWALLPDPWRFAALVFPATPMASTLTGSRGVIWALTAFTYSLALLLLLRGGARRYYFDPAPN